VKRAIVAAADGPGILWGENNGLESTNPSNPERSAALFARK